MKTLLIVYHSRTGACAQMAAAAAEGAAQTQGVNVLVLKAAAAEPAAILAADGYIFCAPENLASLSGAMKEFFDRNYYAVLGAVAARPYAAMIAAGSDGEGALRQLQRIATGWRLRPVAEPLIIITHAQTQEAILAPKAVEERDLARCRDLGAALAEGLALGVF